MAAQCSRRSVTLPRGFRAAGTTCGLKASGASDLALIVSDAPCSAAGMLTRSRCPGEPVKVARSHLRRADCRAIVCNSGTANVATHRQGRLDALAMAQQVADYIDCKRHQVLPSSTGVIGPPLAMDKIGRGIATALSKLGRGALCDNEAARAILTTDLVPKAAARRFRLGNRFATIAGIAKGSGMIAPNMATMLAFLTTDADIKPAVLRLALKGAVDTSFNRISIDEDTSTSDSVFILANGLAGNRRITSLQRAAATFVAALTEVCHSLAQQIVQDGEGATKVFRVHVKRARSQRDADRVGKTVVASPLVKAAVHGGDPNWGRLIMAVGRSGAAVNMDTLSLFIGDIALYRNGCGLTLSKTVMRKLHSLMSRHEIELTIDLGIGRSNTCWLGCDLSRQYVAINADYTT